jgi:hypothetical protein
MDITCVGKLDLYLTYFGITHIRGVHRIGLDVYNPTIG